MVLLLFVAEIRCFGCVALLPLVTVLDYKKFLFYDHPSLMMQFSGLTIRVRVIKVESRLLGKKGRLLI
jgi:hypothetical protein